MKQASIKLSLEASLTALNATLYAVFGYITYLGLFTPVFGTVRFWPSVVIPAAFAILFSPKIGGLGAAIGIFISDMLIHGNPLLSISVGVPSNFIAFYLIGKLTREWKEMTPSKIFLSILLQMIPIVGCLAIYFGKLLDEFTASIFLGVAVIAFTFTLITSIVQRRYLTVVTASSIGLLAGSAIIGFGLWAYSQFFILPIGGIRNAPLVAALVWFLWTYLTEIPFLHFVLPPLLTALVKALPSRFKVRYGEAEAS